jgi:putative hydrolase of the HAD superfamily
VEEDMRLSNGRVLSFDLDGTLVTHDFSTAIWREAIPELVARQRGLPLEEAKRRVFAEYESVGEGALEWYDLAYWYSRFRLDEDWQETLERHRHLIRLYPEVKEVLRSLGERYPMIILSNASHPFVNAEMAVGGLEGAFRHVVSATSDWGQVKKTRAFYEAVCEKLALDPGGIIHVGDHWEFDYLAPQEAGIQSYFLDRNGTRNGPEVVKDLTQFAARISGHSA